MDMDRLNNLCLLQTFIFVICLPKSYIALEDVTGNVLQGENNGIIAAFGDFNADKLTDIFVIRENGTVLQLLMAVQEKFSQETFKSVPLYTSKISNTTITSVVPADFDGDSRMDVLVTRKVVGQNFTNVTIYWGIVGGLGENFSLPDLLMDQPLVLDANGDMIPDLLGETQSGQRLYFTSWNRNFTKIPVKNGTSESLPPLTQPQNGAFVDLNNDLTADLCVMSMLNGSPQLEMWLYENKALTWKESVPVNGMKVIGQVAIADFNGDQSADILLPACVDEWCQKSDIFVLVGNKWVPLNIGLDNDGLSWGFIRPDHTPVSSYLYIPITIRVGDFNLDGFPDLLTVVGNMTGSLHRGLILYNVGCNSCPLRRTFSADWSTWLEGHGDITLLPAFYDLYEDGILDVVVSSVIPSNATIIRTWKHKFDDDASFIKVMVSGLCSNDCPGGNEPYGVNQMGPVIRYSTTGADGNAQTGAATQLSQSAYMALQLPYTVFGLGQTPNFVDSLDVGIPYPLNGKPRHRTWTSIIPNSQLIVIPHPLDEPNSWSNRLFVTPSRLMLLTGAALLGTCGFVAGIVGILHWRDKVEDKKEKRQEAHRFHFDAM
ncbi:hypothetical protein CHS0354_018163 [Potamilus streckersoni]|uniref:T-cell immunomodulatory protein TIP C2 domain-containing protein n=1 Tax=Potamilus streckersoni TaxID=2493646 RepID=A0AAE0W0J7_9BIVA|nr:hypothetical protein CHS0354_018163 [Potamilus streckersoni]